MSFAFSEFKSYVMEPVLIPIDALIGGALLEAVVLPSTTDIRRLTRHSAVRFFRTRKMDVEPGVRLSGQSESMNGGVDLRQSSAIHFRWWIRYGFKILNSLGKQYNPRIEYLAWSRPAGLRVRYGLFTAI